MHMDDIRSYFGASSSKSSPTDGCNTDTEPDSDTDHLQVTPAKKPRTTSSSQQRRSKSCALSSKRGYNKKWEKEFTWLEYSDDHQGAFCKICKNMEYH